MQAAGTENQSESGESYVLKFLQQASWTDVRKLASDNGVVSWHRTRVEVERDLAKVLANKAAELQLQGA
tara:strand:- start:1285 stop:1491 length:207 start_codon:yes stop_codon:yes gene_type:complete